MKIVFYGNCQAQAASFAIQARNKSLTVEYAGNSHRVDLFDPERSWRLLDEADAIVTQSIMNMDNEDNHEALRARFGDRAIFMPYVFVDGLHSFSLTTPVHHKLVVDHLLGGTFLLDHLRRHGVRKTIWDYRVGKIDFHHRDRFNRTMAEMRRREAASGCEIRIADDIERMYRTSQKMLTHNHPSPDLMNIISGKIADRLGLSFSDITPEEMHAYARIILPVSVTIATPWCKSELGLTYPYDLQWFFQGRDMIQRLARAYEIGDES